MYSVIRATNYGTAIYYVAWIIWGRFVFLSLFLAVTLEAFEQKYDPETAKVRCSARGWLGWLAGGGGSAGPIGTLQGQTKSWEQCALGSSGQLGAAAAICRLLPVCRKRTVASPMYSGGPPCLAPPAAAGPAAGRQEASQGVVCRPEGQAALAHHDAPAAEQHQPRQQQQRRQPDALPQRRLVEC
jgi:hypothetical protein